MAKVIDGMGVLEPEGLSLMEDKMTTEEKKESLEELLSQVKHEKKKLFLENYPKFNIVQHTCDAIGIGDASVWRWLHEDELFNKTFKTLKKEITAKLIELHEQNIDNVAFSKETPAQSRIFGSLVRLRAEAPDKYREKTVTEAKLTGNITIKMAIPRPDNPQITIGQVPQIKTSVQNGADNGQDTS